MKRALFICHIGMTLPIHAQNEKRPIQDELARLDNRTIRIVEELDSGSLNDYFERSEQAVRRELSAYTQSHEGKAPNGVTIYSNGKIKISGKTAPQWMPASRVFADIFGQLSREASRKQVEKILIETGFRQDDLKHLEPFDTNHPQSFHRLQQDRFSQMVLSHPHSFLYFKPTIEQLDRVSDEQILEYITDISEKSSEIFESAVTEFLEKIHPQSRRVFMNVVYDHYLADTTTYLHLPKTIEHAKSFRKEKLKLAHQNERQ